MIRISSMLQILNTFVQKLPTNMQFMVNRKKNWLKPIFQDFNDWLEEKAEPHN